MEFTADAPLCPIAYQHVAPRDAHPLIELLEPGGSAHRFAGKYFYLGYTSDTGIAISVGLSHFFAGGDLCYLPLDEMERLKKKLSKIPLPRNKNHDRCDEISGILRIHFPRLEIINPDRPWFPPAPESFVFDLIQHVEHLIACSPTRQPCKPYITTPALDDAEL